MKIGLKLIIAIASLVFLGIIITGVIYYFIGEQTIEKRTEAQLGSIAILKSSMFSGFIDERIKDIQILSDSVTLRENFVEMRLHSKETIGYNFHQMKIYTLFSTWLSNEDFVELWFQ